MSALRLTLAVVALAVAGCAGAPVPADRFHRLEVAPPAAPTPIAQVIGVDPVRAGGIYSERALLYVRDGASEQRRFDFWAEPPDRLVEDALLNDLRAAFGADHVVTAGGRARADWTVRTRIVRLEQLSDAARATVVLEFLVSDPAGKSLAVIESGGTHDIAGSTPQDFVRGVAEQCRRSFDQLAAQLRQLAQAPPPRP